MRICENHDGPCYWLAEDTWPSPRLIDGCHSSPEGVARAAKLHNRIFDHTGAWIMVRVEPVPWHWNEVEINEEAADECAELVRNNADQR